MKNNMWGVIFDFDGVIMDTESHHDVCWRHIAKKENRVITDEHFMLGTGVRSPQFIEEILQWTTDPEERDQIVQDVDAYFQEYIKAISISCLPGIEALVEALHSNKIPMAIGSSSSKKNIEILLERTRIRSFFKAIIGQESVVKGKPDPEVFIKAAKTLSLPPERCVVIEDSIKGIAAAKRAGCIAVALSSTFEKKEFLEQPYVPDVLLGGSQELSIATLCRFFVE